MSGAYVVYGDVFRIGDSWNCPIDLSKDTESEVRVCGLEERLKQCDRCLDADYKLFGCSCGKVLCLSCLEDLSDQYRVAPSGMVRWLCAEDTCEDLSDEDSDDDMYHLLLCVFCNRKKNVWKNYNATSETEEKLFQRMWYKSDRRKKLQEQETLRRIEEAEAKRKLEIEEAEAKRKLEIEEKRKEEERNRRALQRRCFGFQMDPGPSRTFPF